MLALTERHVRAVYTALAMLPPFSKWRMPDEYRIELGVSKSNRAYGLYDSDPHSITISKIQCKHFSDVIMTMAHEMVHLYLERCGDPDHSNHEGRWSETAAEVCTQFGWQTESF
jgi:Zn-dependent peptidase ImmA (M78 family)